MGNSLRSAFCAARAACFRHFGVIDTRIKMIYNYKESTDRIAA